MKSPFIKFGVIYGVVSIIISLIIYLIKPALFANLWLPFLLLLIPIFFMAQAISGAKVANEGYIDFGAAFVQGLGTAFIGTVISMVFTYILYNFIDTNLEEFVKSELIVNLSGLEELVGEVQFDRSVEDIESKDMASIGATIQNILGGTLFGAIIALIVAAIMKKNRPMIDALDDEV